MLLQQLLLHKLLLNELLLLHELLLHRLKHRLLGRLLLQHRHGLLVQAHQRRRVEDVAIPAAERHAGPQRRGLHGQERASVEQLLQLLQLLHVRLQLLLQQLLMLQLL